MIKIIIIAIVVSSLLGGVALHFRNYNQCVKESGVMEKTIETLEQDARTYAGQIESYKLRIAEKNARWVKELEDEKQRTKEARIAADEAVRSRADVAAELAKVRRKWMEAVANDGTLASFVRIDVPDPVWDRLQGAAGQTGR